MTFAEQAEQILRVLAEGPLVIRKYLRCDHAEIYETTHAGKVRLKIPCSHQVFLLLLEGKWVDIVERAVTFGNDSSVYYGINAAGRARLAQPRIIVLEKSEERELLCKKLREEVKGFTITPFESFGEFLEAFEGLADSIKLIIMEDRLTLVPPRQDSEEFRARLDRTFPEAVAGWKPSKAPEALLIHLNILKFKIPVVLYTHSFPDWIEKTVIEHPSVTYHNKAVKIDVLISGVKRILSHTPVET